MGVILEDCATEDRWVICNWWNWRPTIELLRTSGVFDAQTLELMGYNGLANVSEAQARDIASFMEERVLPSLRSGDRVLLDGSITDAPDDGTFYREPAEHAKNYSATECWLRTFSEFCRVCKGFRVF